MNPRATESPYTGPLEFSNYEEVRRVVPWPVAEPRYLPEDMVLTKVLLFEWPSGDDSISRELLRLIKAGQIHRGTLETAYNRPGETLVIFQGWGTWNYPLEKVPPDAKGTIQLDNGLTATWIRGSLTLPFPLSELKGGSAMPFLEWRDGSYKLLWRTGDQGVQMYILDSQGNRVPDPTYYGFRIESRVGLPLEELVKVANSLR